MADNYYSFQILKKIFLLLFSFCVFASQLIGQNIHGKLLYKETKDATASKCEFYSSSELLSNSEMTFKIIFSTDNPSPLGKYNQLGAGLAALIVPEDAYVNYNKIKIYYSIYADREEYKEYVPSSESEKNWWKFFELVVSKVPYLGTLMQLKPLYDYTQPDYDNKIDGNEYDIVKADWDAKKLEIWRKVKIEIPVKVGQNTKFGLYAFWITKASNESGPIYQRENIVTKGIISEKEISIIDNEQPCIPTVKYEGKTYNTVRIGSQCWLKENLDVGTMIKGSQDQTNNRKIEKYCYDNDPNNCEKYGGLYQWNEAIQNTTTDDAQGICPPGWYIPSPEDFKILKRAVNDDARKLKEIGLGVGNGIGNNSSGFSALLVGIRSFDSNFYSLDSQTVFWGFYNSFNPTTILLDNSFSILAMSFTKTDGFSVRCIKD